MTVIVLGSANADLVFPVPVLPAPGETVLGDSWHSVPGGKGANQAVAAARDGAATSFYGAVGQDVMAGIATAALEASGVDLSGLARLAVPTGCAALTVDPRGRNQIAVASGANQSVSATQLPDSALGPDTVLVLQMEIPIPQTAQAIRRAKMRGARVILNLAPAAAIDPDVFRLLDLLIVNEHEAAWLAGHLSCADDPAALRAATGCDLVVTRGEEGAILARQDGLTPIPAFPVKAVDTIGAGDCFCGVLAAALDRGMDLDAALHRATVAAGLACTRSGSANAMPMAAEINEAIQTSA